MRLGIGIDTGGTYTDAVAYDFSAGKILATAKSLTTRDDLSRGIMAALDRLPPELTRKPDLIALSTTLATNACVEDRLGRAKLVFLGGDARVIDRYGAEFGLPPSDEMYIQESHTTFSGAIGREMDWDRFVSGATRDIAGLDGIGLIEMNAMRNSAVIEKKAKELLRAVTDIPIVCGHELFMELSCLQRGASTLLNASLFPVIRSFVAAIGKAMRERDIAAPVVIVRSDGSLMGQDFATFRPVETLLCGPAASVIGGMELSGERNCVVVDMGGTTTDIALMRDGVPVMAENGIAVGGWQTFVKGLYINTFGLGGDSAVHYRDNRLVLENYRVVPLCIAAHAHPGMLEELENLLSAVPRHTRFLHEFFILARDIGDGDRYTDMEKRFCEALRRGPLIRRSAAAAVGKDEYNLDVSRLLREGVVQLCGLTPTDVMHIRKDFTRYRTDASLLGAAFVASNLDIAMDALCDLVYDEIKRKLYLNIVKILLENENDDYRRKGVGPDIERLVGDSYYASKNGPAKGFVLPRFQTDLALVGIGAPIHLFLDDVARRLGTKAVVPEHSGVANALGAVVGNIHASHEILIRPAYNTDGIAGFVVLGNDARRTFAQLADAEAFALSEAEDGARAEAGRRGASGEITVSSTVKKSEVDTREGNIYLGSAVIAHAVGSAGW